MVFWSRMSADKQVLTPRLVSSLSYEHKARRTMEVLDERRIMEGTRNFGRRDGQMDKEGSCEQPLTYSSDVTLDGPLREPRRLSPSPGRLPLLRHRGIAGVRQTGRMVG